MLRSAACVSLVSSSHPFNMRVMCASSMLCTFRNVSNQSRDRPDRNVFRAPPNVGSGRSVTDEANPYKSWKHMNHTWLAFMCVGCLCGGILAGRFADVDETKLQPKFSKEEVMDAAAKQFEFRPDLAATSIRVAFVLAARRAGFSAPSLDESCAVSDGLTEVAGVLNFLANTFNASVEDIAALTALAAVKYLNGPYETALEQWRWGRNDSDVPPRRNEPADAQRTCFSLPTILRHLGDLTDEECVALMACHGVGEFHENVSGLDGQTRIGKRYHLSNAYYRFLLDHSHSLRPMEVSRTEENKGLPKLPSTLLYTYVQGKHGKRKQCVVSQAEVDALVSNPTWRAITERYARDEDAWRRHFQSALTKMLDSNFKRLRVYAVVGEGGAAPSSRASRPGEEAKTSSSLE